MAANFLSTCGSERGAPECNTHPSPTDEPQVGQLTEEICFGVSSFRFTEARFDELERQVCSKQHTLRVGPSNDTVLSNCPQST
jgi:hypothetical protein